MASADIVILAIVLLSALIGLARGLFREVLSLATWVAAVVLALGYWVQVAEYLEEQITDATARQVVAMAGVFVGTLILGGLAQWLIGALVKGTGLTGTDRLLGFVFGGARGLIVCVVGLIAMRSFAQSAAWWQASLLVPELLAFEQELLDVLGTYTGWRSMAGGGE